MPRKRHARITRSKLDREHEKRERQKAKRSGKPAGEPGTGLPKNRGQRQWVELKRIGGGKFPNFTPEGLSELRREGKTNIGPYGFVKDYSRSTETLLFFEASQGVDLTSRRRKFLGLFLIDLREKTIRQVEDRSYDEAPVVQKERRAAPQTGKKPFKLTYAGNRKSPPEITQEVLSRLERLEDVKSGQLTFTVDRENSGPGRVVVTIEAGIRKKRMLGKYTIYPREKSVYDFP